MAPSSLQVEIVLLAACAVFAWVAPVRSRRFGHPVWTFLGRAARTTWQACLLAALIPVVLRLALLPVIPVPVPGIHDEFSLLLLADTFSNGRLANPPHPHWQHFETFFVLHQPVYASQYPPGSAAALALGQMVFGHPWAGVLVSVGILGAALFWGLRPWLPARWALLGAIVAGLRLGVFGYWVNSYWGGALTAAAGAVAIGGFGRLLRYRTFSAGAAFGAGGCALLLIRPFEGALLIGACGLIILWKWASVPWRGLLRPAFGAIAFLSLGAALMLAYAYRVTGSPLRLPHSVILEQYGFNQVLPWLQPARAPQHRHEPMQKFLEVADLENRKRFSNPRSAILWQLQKAYVVIRAFAGPLLLLPLVCVPLLWKGRFRPLLVVTFLFAAGCLFHLFYTPHYAAPVTAVFFALVVGAWRYLWLALHPRSWFAAMAALLPYCLIASTMYTALTADVVALSGRPTNTWENRVWPGNLARDRIMRQLPAERKHLLLVRYGPNHDCYEEWVHNLADLDKEQVVWARSISPDKDASLAAYYHDRQIWLVEPDERPIRIHPFTSGRTAFSSPPAETHASSSR